MRIEEMPRVLTWTECGGTLLEIHHSYVQLLLQRLGETLAVIRKVLPGIADALQRDLLELPDRAFIRLLTAPETTYRLLWPREHDAGEVADFLRVSITAEMCLLGRAEPSNGSIWTALGDARFSAHSDGPTIADDCTPKVIPIDFSSPYALHIDLNGTVPRTTQPVKPLSTATRPLVVRKIVNALQAIQEASPLVADFVVGFTKVLIPLEDLALPSSFTSGSSGQFVGRSVLGNPHLQNIDVVMIAEGIVHEAIHSLLYMQEQQRPWVHSPELYGPELRTVSPWTGNSLPLRPYLQAAFVWYGLVHFWAQVLCMAQHTSFDPLLARERLEQATLGFLGPRLSGQLQDHSQDIADELLYAIGEMQERVKSTFFA